MFFFFVNNLLLRLQVVIRVVQYYFLIESIIDAIFIVQFVTLTRYENKLWKKMCKYTGGVDMEFSPNESFHFWHGS